MKFLLLTFVFCLTLFSCTQNNEKSNDLTTHKTDKHINIPGTRLFIVPSRGFEISKSLIGLQKGDSCMIQIYDLIGGDFYSNAKNVSKKAFEEKGLKVLDYYEFQLNGYPAKYCHLQGANNILSHQLIFGDSTFCVMVLGAYPVGQDENGDEIKESIFSIFYDKSTLVDPMATALFSVDDSKSKFKFHESSSNMFSYTLDGKKNSDRHSPLVVISQIVRDQDMTFESISEMLKIGLEQNGFIMNEIESQGMKSINGKEVYEKVFIGYFNVKKVKVYQLIFMTSNQWVTFTGLTYSDNENNMNEFKKLSATLKIKE